MKEWFGPVVCREVLGIFFAAVVLGLAYNRSSPLGVSFARSAPAAPATALVEKTVPPGERDPAIYNETITAVIVANGPENPAAPARKLPATLPWAEVKSLLAKGEIVLVDGRTAAAYQAGHIPGAISLPLQTLADNIAAFNGRYAKNQPLVVYCASLQCPISRAEATVLAEQHGYLNVREMPGGFAEWRVAEPSAVAATGANP